MVRTRHRRDLPAGNGIDQSLLSRAFAGPVRRDPALRSHPRGRAAGAHCGMGNGRSRGDVPVGAIKAGLQSVHRWSG